MPKKKILLHICCAPCAAGCLDMLRANELEIGFYFSNSNLNSPEEYQRRLEAARTLAAAENIPLFSDPYDHDAWLTCTAALADAPEGGERCARCFAFSLERTALAAAELSYPAFATSLTVSPHKDSSLIFRIGSRHARFEPWNFKKKDGFLKGVRRAGELHLYRQNYCGCEFSLRGRRPGGAGQSVSGHNS